MIYHSYYVIANKDNMDQFLTEDKTFADSLDRAVEFESKEDAQATIDAYKENENDDYFSGDYYISEKLEIRNVNITIS